MKNERKSYSIFGIVSLSIAVALSVLILNHFLQIVPLQKTKFQGLAVLLPIVISPIGIITGIIGLRKARDRMSLLGVVVNLLLFSFPMFYWVVGTLIWGP